jgi:hypothetical protein
MLGRSTNNREASLSRGERILEFEEMRTLGF